MNEVVFERAVPAEPARALKALEQWFTTNGYTVAARSSLELHLLGAGHRLSLRADGLSVRFGFTPGAPGVKLPQPEELERRVDTALQAFGSPPAPAKPASSPGGRCSICATPLGAGQTHCPTCGMAQR